MKPPRPPRQALDLSFVIQLFILVSYPFGPSSMLFVFSQEVHFPFFFRVPSEESVCSSFLSFFRALPQTVGRRGRCPPCFPSASGSPSFPTVAHFLLFMFLFLQRKPTFLFPWKQSFDLDIQLVMQWYFPLQVGQLRPSSAAEFNRFSFFFSRQVGIPSFSLT